MQYLRGYGALRDDPTWTSKIIAGWVLMLSALVVPIVGQVAVAGWGAYALRRVVARELARREGRDRADLEGLPPLALDMDLIGKLMGPGFKAFIVRFLWTLPLMVLVGGAFGCLWLGAMLGAGAIAEGSGNRDLAGVLSCCMTGSILLLLPLAIAAQVPAMFAALRTELTDDMGEGLKFAEVMAMTRALFGPATLGVLLQGAVNTLLALAGAILCYFPAFAAGVVGAYAMADLQAQLYLRWLDQGGAPLAKLADPTVPARAPAATWQPPPGAGQPPGPLPPGSPGAGWQTPGAGASGGGWGGPPAGGAPPAGGGWSQG